MHESLPSINPNDVFESAVQAKIIDEHAAAEAKQAETERLEREKAAIRNAGWTGPVEEKIGKRSTKREPTSEELKRNQEENDRAQAWLKAKEERRPSLERGEKLSDKDGYEVKTPWGGAGIYEDTRKLGDRIADEVAVSPRNYDRTMNRAQDKILEKHASSNIADLSEAIKDANEHGLNSLANKLEKMQQAKVAKELDAEAASEQIDQTKVDPRYLNMLDRLNGKGANVAVRADEMLSSKSGELQAVESARDTTDTENNDSTSQPASREAAITGDIFEAPKTESNESVQAQEPARRPKPGAGTANKAPSIEEESGINIDDLMRRLKGTKSDAQSNENDKAHTSVNAPEVSTNASEQTASNNSEIIDHEEKFHAFVNNLSEPEHDAVKDLSDYIKGLAEGESFRTRGTYSNVENITNRLSIDKYLETLNHFENMGILSTNHNNVHDDRTTPKRYWTNVGHPKQPEASTEPSLMEQINTPFAPSLPDAQPATQEQAVQPETPSVEDRVKPEPTENELIDEEAESPDGNSELAQPPKSETSDKRSKKESKEAKKAKRSEERRRKLGGGLLQRFRDAGNYLPDNYGEADYVAPSMGSRVKNVGKPSEESLVAGARSLARDAAYRTEVVRYRQQLEADAATKLLDPNNPESPKLKEKAFEKKVSGLIQEHMKAFNLDEVAFNPTEYTPQYGEVLDESKKESTKDKKQRSVGRMALRAQRRLEERQAREQAENEARERRRIENGLVNDDLHDDLASIGQ